MISRSLTSLGYSFLEAWIVMLLLGAAHSSDASVPAFGFWVTFILCYCVSSVVSGAIYFGRRYGE